MDETQEKLREIMYSPAMGHAKYTTWGMISFFARCIIELYKRVETLERNTTVPYTPPFNPPPGGYKITCDREEVTAFDGIKHFKWNQSAD